MIVRYSGAAPQTESVITVYLHGTQVSAVLYADGLGTPLGNPFLADALTGLYTFWADDAVSYDIIISLSPTSALIVNLPGMPRVLFSGTSPARTASLVVDDPVLGQVVLLQIGY